MLELYCKTCKKTLKTFLHFVTLDADRMEIRCKCDKCGKQMHVYVITNEKVELRWKKNLDDVDNGE